MSLDGLRVRDRSSFTFAEADRLLAVSSPGAWEPVSGVSVVGGGAIPLNSASPRPALVVATGVLTPAGGGKGAAWPGTVTAFGPGALAPAGGGKGLGTAQPGWVGATATTKRSACFLMLNAMQDLGLFGIGVKREGVTFYCWVDAGPGLVRLPCQGGMAALINFIFVFSEANSVRLGAAFPTVRVGAGGGNPRGRWADYADDTTRSNWSQGSILDATYATTTGWYAELVGATDLTGGGAVVAGGGGVATGGGGG